MHDSGYTVLGLAVLLLAVSGCQSTPARIADKEEQLLAAGFVAIAADTPERLLELETLPANKMILRVDPGIGNSEYVYADPVQCRCLYVGGQEEFERYWNEVHDGELLDQQESSDHR